MSREGRAELFKTSDERRAISLTPRLGNRSTAPYERGRRDLRRRDATPGQVLRLAEKWQEGESEE